MNEGHSIINLINLVFSCTARWAAGLEHIREDRRVTGRNRLVDTEKQARPIWAQSQEHNVPVHKIEGSVPLHHLVASITHGFETGQLIGQVRGETRS